MAKKPPLPRAQRRAQFAALKRSGRLTADATWAKVYRTEATKAALPGGLNVEGLARAGITIGATKANLDLSAPSALREVR